MQKKKQISGCELEVQRKHDEKKKRENKQIDENEELVISQSKGRIFSGVAY